MSSKNAPQVVTVEGPVQGTVDGNISVFKGIPYAAPPVGALRWRAPEPVTRWTDTLQTNAYGDSSLQDWDMCIKAGGGDPRPTSEDCLYLNVWTSQLGVGSGLLPVMVWIHGGGYVLGAAGLPPYNGKPLAEAGVVVVSVNYRLGHLGFFAHPALDDEYDGEEKIVNNFGLLDQIAALQWVQRNIARFGGDESNVTIFGQSAGGRSVLSLFASPLAAGLFHKGIAQSVYGLPDVTREDALNQGEALATYFGLNAGDVTAEELRALDGNLFWEGKDEKAPPKFGGPVPISGDVVFPKPLFEVFEAKEQAKLPLIIGNTSDDSSVLDDFGFSSEDVIAILRKIEQYDTVKAFYPDIADGDEEELGRQVGRDLLFTTMTHLIAEKQRAVVAPSWRYYFDYIAEKKREEPPIPKGARHGDEIPYTMDTVDIAPPTSGYATEEDKAFAQKVSHYWVEFAKVTTDESTSIAGVVEWPKHIVINIFKPNKTIRFGKDLGNSITLEDNFMWERIALFGLFLPKLGDLIPKGAESIHSYQTK